MEQIELTSNPEFNFENLADIITKAINQKNAEVEKLKKPPRCLINVLLLNGAHQSELINFFNNNSGRLFKQVAFKANGRTYPLVVNFITYQELVGKSADRLQREMNLGLLLPINPGNNEQTITSQEIFEKTKLLSNLAEL